MARVSGRDAHLLVIDSESASRNLGGRSNSVTLNLTSEEVDVTSFGALWRERVADALRDWTLDIAGFWDGAASQLDGILYGIHAACTSLCFGPSGSTSGNIQYSGCVILQDFVIETAVDGAVTWTATFQSASQLNRGTYA